MKRRALALGLTAAALLAACGGDDGISETAIENAIEDQTGDSVDINVEDGEVKVETSDGTITYSSDNDGQVKVSTDDGSFEGGTGSKLPDGFPKAVPLPDLTLQSSYSATENGETTYLLSYESKDIESDFADYKKALQGKGYTIEGDYTGTANGVFTGSLSAGNGTWQVDLFANGENQGLPGTLSVSVTPESE